jgi:hypothetical protein
VPARHRLCHCSPLPLAGCAAGVFLLAVAALLRWYAAPHVTPPRGEYRVTVARGTGIAYADWYRRPRPGRAAIRMTTTVREDRVAERGDVAVLDRFTAIETANRIIDLEQDRVAFDRKTGAPVPCCGVHVQGNTHLHATGLVGKWPRGALRRAYMVFDPATGRPFPARYAGAATLYGLRLYRYDQRIPATRLRDETVPGGVFGTVTPQVQATRYYAGIRTYWVEPDLGVVVTTTEWRNEWLRHGRATTTLLSVTLQSSAAEVRNAVRTAAGQRDRYEDLYTHAPVAAAPVGLVALVLGGFTAAGRRGGEDEN